MEFVQESKNKTTKDKSGLTHNVSLTINIIMTL